ncbi:hypothetical protein OROMI_026015 [Orobanche minor]
MKCLSWNCRGLGHPLAIPNIAELVRIHRPEIIFLFETLAHKSRVEEIRVRLKFSGCFVVENVGHSGGICALWKDSSLCSLTVYSNNHIDLRIHGASGDGALQGFMVFLIVVKEEALGIYFAS